MSSDIPPVLSTLRHFLAIQDTSPEVLTALIELSIRRKIQFRRGELRPMLQGKTLAMIFQKSSLRTRLSFETAMTQLGGHAIYLEDHQVGVATREDIRDMARVTSSMCDGICARVFGHEIVEKLAAHGTVPVINALSDWAHPCQALADMMTLQERFGRLAGLRLAYVGDANNVARSLLNACTKLGVSVALASPAGYQIDKAQVDAAWPAARETGASITLTEEPAEAVADVDAIYTDVWTSMGQEAEREQRERAFAGYQVNAALLRRAKPTAVVMHCLPAHRNLEITDEVLDGPASIVFQQAENRLHTTRALLEVLLGKPNPG
ncbi:MAG TPA: ornithine carbamoyltransferase [Phycisphaerae bacterium]|jgi:ornithine carbamoyltransferase|nr:ornithine carbamoyltransferase [Phycisphaerae bacterium]HOB75254.1 ornithine carbamoyltransferase [Phycisphaerae bacterium]HOJ55070.1 ornithine carbamoyltransferase [Phycisphaerae bacterium]HOL24912.1 ornithine carbamoyltransferase [Phycisphaerae bacterium]HPP22868.1 ornithine carbamoyltransferase [Phycisphaerae bacterium]